MAFGLIGTVEAFEIVIFLFWTLFIESVLLLARIEFILPIGKWFEVLAFLPEAWLWRMVVHKHLLFSNALRTEGFLVETTLLKLLHEIHMDLLFGLKLFLLKLDALQSVLKIFHLLEILLILIS